MGGGAGWDLCIVTQDDTDIEENQGLPEIWLGGHILPQTKREQDTHMQKKKRTLDTD